MPWRKRSTAPLRLAVTAILMMMAAAVLSGCLGSEPPNGTEATMPRQQAPAPGPWVQVITDPEGDANRRVMTTVDDLTPCMNASSVPGATTCGLQRPWTDSDETQVGPSAGPERDLLGVSFQDSERSLRIRFDMATVPQDLSLLADASAGEGTFMSLVWSASGPCTVGASLEVYPGLGIRAVAYLMVWCDPPTEGNQAPATPQPCEASFCLWPIGLETEPGSPGAIVLEVPRHLLSGGNPDEALRDPRAYVDITRSSGTTGSFRADGAVSFKGLAPSGGYASAIDDASAEPGTTYGYASPWHDPLPDLTPVAPLVLAAPAHADATDRQTLILAVDLVVDAAEVLLDVTMDEVAEAPDDHALFAAAAIGPHVIFAGYTAQDGARTPWADHVARPGAEVVSIPVNVDLEPGRPGHVLFRFDRGTIAPIEDGAVVGGLYVVSFLPTWTEYPTLGGTSVQEYRDSIRMIQVSETRTTVNVPEGVTMTAPGIRLADAASDVAAPLDLTRPSRHYDLLAVDVSSPDPERLQFSIAVEDLSDLSPPDGYDAVFYGVAVEHPHGRTMLGYHQSRDRPGEYLCAPDITILPDAPADPTLTGWETIPGRVLDGTTTDGIGTGASAGGSSVVLFAPRSCFALADTDGALNVTDLAAGSYLIRRAPLSAADTEVVGLDTMEDGGAFDIAFAQARQVGAAPPSFWSQPFGIQNFWDIFGVAIAVAFAMVSATIIVRKRVRMKRYLVRLEDLADHFHDDPEQYAKELVSLRKRLYRDLLANRLTEGHFVMVEERLRSSLSGTRINAFGHAFYDLPPALMIRLQSLLADGRFSRHDHGVLQGLVTKLKIPEGSRQSVHAQLDLWASQDADVAGLAKTHRQRRWWRRWKAAA